MRGWKIGNRVGEVLIGIRIGKQSPDARDDVSKVDSMPQTHDCVWGRCNLKECNAAAWAHNPRRLNQHCIQIHKIAQSEPAGQTIDAGIGKGKILGIGVHECSTGASRMEHAERKVHTNWFEAMLGQVSTEVAGATCHVKYDRTGSEAKLINTSSSPAHIEAKSHETVHQVIARRDRIEHFPDCLFFCRTLGQFTRHEVHARNPSARAPYA